MKNEANRLLGTLMMHTRQTYFKTRPTVQAVKFHDIFYSSILFCQVMPFSFMHISSIRLTRILHSV